MNFSRLIQKHSQAYQFSVKQEGHWDGPNWVDGEEVDCEIEAAIFPLTAEEVDRYEGLGYTTQDIKVFIPAEVIGGKTVVEAYNIEEDTTEQVELDKDDEVSYKSNQYVLDEDMDRTTHADFVKWIAVRKQDGGNDD